MKFTSIKQIPKEAIEMIDDVQWYCKVEGDVYRCPERLSSADLVGISNCIQENGDVVTPLDNRWLYIEPRELEDKTYGINLYKKIHGLN